jgi:hypothetical protein
LFMTSARSSGSGSLFELSDVVVGSDVVVVELYNSSRRAIAADSPMVTARKRSGRSKMFEVSLDRMYLC